ncbi:MAG: hypothetical protein V1776_03250 [Candidatus Diapherotrites archaeon]
MSARMNPLEKFKHYEHQVLTFENKRGWSLGRHTLSEYVFLVIVGFWFAFIGPQFIGANILLAIAIVLTILYVLYMLVLFFLSGGLGRPVDVM